MSQPPAYACTDTRVCLRAQILDEEKVLPSFLAWQVVMRMRNTYTLHEQELLPPEESQQDPASEATAMNRASRIEKGFGVTCIDFIQMLDIPEFEEEVACVILRFSRAPWCSQDCWSYSC